MDALIVVGLIVSAPLVLSLLFRVSAVMLFLSIAIGSLLVKYFGDDASVVLGSFVHSANLERITNLSLQLLPVALTLFFLRKSASAGQFILHIVPLVLSSAALGMMALPLLSAGTQGAFYNTSVGKSVKPADDVIIGAASVSVLLLAWAVGKPHHSGRGKHHK